MRDLARLRSGLPDAFGPLWAMEQIIVEMTATATIAIAVFGVVFSLTQKKYSRVRQSFAMFLAAVAVNNAPAAFMRSLEALPTAFVQQADLIVAFSSVLCLAPLLWIYVVTLTSPAQRRPKHLYRHFLLPALAFLSGLVVVTSPPEVSAALFADAPLPMSAGPVALVAVIVILQLLVYPQIALYLFLILRRLMRYRLKLRDVYASTEEHELRWIYVIGGLGGVFWLAQTLLLVLEFGLGRAGLSTASMSIASIAGLALVATTTLWGLRQHPPLVPDTTVTEPLPERPTGPQSGKYEKSALTPEASSRITRKLRAAMEADHLHRDPNLSLWILARHIGASPNYISQTLNEVIGESFFDFVNGYRINEAKTLLSTTNETVLTITYDVGFNARSSFYNAFNRVTGETPTSYRKKMSQRARMDDFEGAPRNT